MQTLAEMPKHVNGPGGAALSYLRQGWSVFPVHRNKKPVVGWAPYQTALADEAQVQAWWQLSPQANIGLACGPVSGVVVLDVDSEEGLQFLQNRGLTLPETRIVKTGRGLHFYFQDPGVKTKNFANGKTAFPLPHVDFRGHGGYVVIPPSVHENGRAYEWSNGAPIAPLPNWLHDLVLEEMEEPRTVNLQLTPAAGDRGLFERSFGLACQRAAAGARNDAGLWLACQLRDNGCAQTEAESLLLRYAAAVNHCGSHPYTDCEALETVASAFSRSPRERWQPPPDGDATLCKGNVFSDAIQPVETWPVLASEAYATLAGEFVQSIEPYSEADPVALLINVLVAFGCLIGSGPHFLIEHQPHPARLNALLVGRSWFCKSLPLRPSETLQVPPFGEGSPTRCA